MLAITNDLEDLVDRTVSIPTIPTILLEINDVLLSEQGSAREAAEIIERDPAIAAKVLRLVNSPFYGLRSSVSNINLACSVLGLQTIKNLVVQATILDRFSSGPALEEFDVEWLWDHSFKTATAARMLVEAMPGKASLNKDDAYTCGLIHDVGKMVLLQSAPAPFASALRASKGNQLPLSDTEAEIFGFNHAHVVGLLAKRWKLPEHLQVAAISHHSPGSATEEWTPGFLIHAANSIAHEVTEGDGGWFGDCLPDDAMQLLDIPAERLQSIRADVARTSIQA